MKTSGIIFLSALSIAIFLSNALPVDGTTPEVTVGSKKFTESVILGDMVSILVRHAGAQSVERLELGGTRVLWDALLKGEIDIYPEYTGTIIQEILADKSINDEDALRKALGEHGIMMTRSLGFSDNYAIGMEQGTCKKQHITKISDLRNHPEIRFGFSNEFMDRSDGWPGLETLWATPETCLRDGP